jgi:hypothetical protein
LAALDKCLADSNKPRTSAKPTNNQSVPRSPPPPRSADRGRVRQLPLWRGPTSGNPNESPRSYMQPTKLKAIARDAALRGDTNTLFHTLDLLERLLPIATFMDFCTELEELRLQGPRPAPIKRRRGPHLTPEPGTNCHRPPPQRPLTATALSKSRMAPSAASMVIGRMYRSGRCFALSRTAPQAPSRRARVRRHQAGLTGDKGRGQSLL